MDDNFDVVNLEFMGPGEKIGINFYDEITIFLIVEILIIWNKIFLTMM